MSDKMNMNSLYEPLEFQQMKFPFILRVGCINDFPPHWHDCLEIHCVYGGTNDNIILDSYQHPVKAGNIVCINPSQTHWYTKKAPLYYHTLIIHSQCLTACGIQEPTNLTPCFQDRYIYQLFSDIIKETKEKPKYFEASQKAIVMKLLIHLYRNYTSESPVSSNPYLRTDLVIKILNYIKEHYLEDITISKMGKELGISPSYMCACFRQETQTTIKKYINQLRCIDAKHLLLEGKTSVTQVGIRCGFNNMSYFSKTYYNLMKELPSETLKRTSELSNKSKEHDLNKDTGKDITQP